MTFLKRTGLRVGIWALAAIATTLVAGGQDRPVSPGDVCATIYEALGIDPDMPVHDRSGRPVSAAQGGRPIREILG